MPVIYVSTDGLRPDALERVHTPAFDALKQYGAYTLTARSVTPSITLPCHMSVFHSVPPTRHNVLSNVFTPMARPVPGLVDVLAGAGKRCAFFYSWEPLRDLSRPLSLAHSSLQAYNNDPELSDKRVLDTALPFVKRAEFDFVFLYFGAVDEVGHSHGWMTERYLHQVEHTDDLLGQLLTVVPTNTTVIVHSDHGGHARMHGTDKDEDMLIPWFATGRGIKEGHVLEKGVTLLDTAPLVAKLLSVPAPQAWEGKLLNEALVTAI